MPRSETRRFTHAIVQRAVEALDARQLFAAAPELLAFPDIQTSGTRSPTLGAVVVYDVSDVRAAGNDPFQTTPLFSIFPGFEITRAGATVKDYEEQTAFAVAPNGRTAYMLGADFSTSAGTSVSGDTINDYDLYRFDLAAAYNDFITNNRPRGIEYLPRYSPDYNPTNPDTNTGIDYVTEYAGRAIGPTGLPSVTTADDGIPALRVDSSVIIRDNTDTIGSNDVIFMDGIVAKVGEIARPPTPSGVFFNQQDIQVVDDNTILLMEQAQLANSATTATPQQDYSIRTIERVSTSPGLATFHAATNSGGYNSQTKESWESFQWTGDNYVNMDTATDISDVDGMRYVNRDGVKGVWVSDFDGAYTELGFFKLDFATRTATKLQVLETPTGTPSLTIKVDEDPSTSITTNDGDVDGFDLDANQNLVIRESNFISSTSTLNAEGKPITIAITNYNGPDSNGDGKPEVIVGAQVTKPTYAPTVDDDTGVTNTQFGSVDPNTGLLYIFDTDSAATDGAAAAPPDAYVYDLATGTFILQKLNIPNTFIQDGNQLKFFTLQPLDNVPPTVASTAFNYAGSRQSVSVVFSENVGASLAAGDFILTNNTTGNVVPAADISLSYNATTFTATLLFSGVPGAAGTTSLSSGRYSISFGAGTVSDAAGNALAAGTKGTFAFKDGDFDGSLTPDFVDLLTLAKNYGKTSGVTFASGDADYDGTVGFSDLLILAKNYGQALPPAPAAAASVVRKSTRATATVTI